MSIQIVLNKKIYNIDNIFDIQFKLCEQLLFKDYKTLKQLLKQLNYDTINYKFSDILYRLMIKYLFKIEDDKYKIPQSFNLKLCYKIINIYAQPFFVGGELSIMKMLIKEDIKLCLHIMKKIDINILLIYNRSIHCAFETYNINLKLLFKLFIKHPGSIYNRVIDSVMDKMKYSYTKDRIQFKYKFKLYLISVI